MLVFHMNDVHLLGGMTIDSVLRLKRARDADIKIAHSPPNEDGKFSGWLVFKQPSGDGLEPDRVATAFIFNSDTDAEDHARAVLQAARAFQTLRGSVNPEVDNS